MEREPDPGVTRFTGRLLDRSGTPIVGSQILGERPGGIGATGADGTFDVEDDSVPVGAGLGVLEFRNGARTAALPPSWEIRSSQVPHPDGDVVELGDISLGTVQPVTITVVDPDGVAVPGAFFDASAFNTFARVPARIGPYAAEAVGRYQSDVVAGADGVLTLQLFQNTGATGFLRQYDLQFEPPTGVDSCDFSRYNLAGDNVAFDVAGPTAFEAVLGTDIDEPFCDGEGPTPTVVGGTVTLAGSVGGRVFVGFTDDSGAALASRRTLLVRSPQNCSAASSPWTSNAAEPTAAVRMPRRRSASSGLGFCCDARHFRSA